MHGNPAELRELLTNLVINAVDAMPDGGTITIGTSVERRVSSDETQAPTHVVLTVRDTGTGMTEEVRGKCLDPFFTTKGDQGTGLGLSMVHGIVRRHNGSLDIESEPGKGTTFFARLPGGEEGAARIAEPQEAPRPRPMRILCIDDEPLVRSTVTDYLTEDGHTVETAADGREGLEKFQAAQFDLIITDRAMPEISGEQLAAAIKQVAPNKPIIMLTGFGDQMAATGQHPEAVDLIIAKPVTFMGLREAVAKATAE